MAGIHTTCRTTAEEYGVPGNYVVGANIAGFVRVAGTVPDLGMV
jgi:glutamate dehydrogenase (NADP+)